MCVDRKGKRSVNEDRKVNKHPRKGRARLQSQRSWPTRKERKMKSMLALRLFSVGRRKHIEYEVRRISVVRFRL